MDRDPHQPLSRPLTTEEAKARLRVAAQDVTLATWMEERTWPLVAVAVVGGFVAARLRLPTLLGSVLIQRAAPILLGLLLARKGTGSGAPPHS